jgi:poly-gamma-glutamate synthesis protein (capsule biosynthesis protein)
MDILVTANNHCVDTGKKGLERTIDMLDSLRIPHTGTFKEEVDRLNDHPLLIEKDSFRLSILNYTFSTNGLPVANPNVVNRIDTARIRNDLIKAKDQKPDITVVFLHWGVEYQSLPNAQQKMVTEFCFANGAQLVIGAHPHVLQPMEWRKDKNQLVAYSLGNFVSGQRKRYTDGGSVLYLELEKIKHKPDSSVTMIDSAGYLLEYVYRTTDARKKYYVMPAPTVENDTMSIIGDTASRASFRIFVDDSRKLFNKYNVSIPEIKVQPSRKPEEQEAGSVELKQD